MEFVDLKSQYRRLEASVRERMDKVLEHGRYVQGPEVVELEGRLSGFTGAAHCIACSSGTDALLMALMAKGVGPGDAVFTSPFTFIATAEAIALLGATPVFVDIDPVTLNLDPEKLAKAVDGLAGGGLRARGVIPVDLFGLPADYSRINRLAESRGLFVLADAAQSLGGSVEAGDVGGQVGNLAEMTATSFFPSKPLGCYGDGGAVFTSDDALAERLISIRSHGMRADKYEHIRLGLNGRLDTLQAAVLLAKLEIFKEELIMRETIAARYTSALSSVVECPVVPPGYRSAWAQYSVRGVEKARILAALQAEGIPTAVYYPKPLHLQEAFAYLGYQKGDLPEAERASSFIFSLPMHPYLSEMDQDRVIRVIQDAAGGKI